MNINKYVTSHKRQAFIFCASASIILYATLARADQVILDDLIVDGSICVGLDCVNGESFGFDTLRLKENNLRIKFQDTSTSASFPTNDWQITANDSSNGGANKFSIDDIDGGRTPFTLEAGAPSHSLYVDDGGRLGLGTSTPVVDVHVKSGNTPTLRLEQDGTSGFSPQTWDVAGNEANFFIRDTTNGSKLPFRLFPNAPSNALTIEGVTGDIGLGTTSPDSVLHLRRTNVNEPKIKVHNAGGLGGASIDLVNDFSGDAWKITSKEQGGFKIRDDANSFDALVINRAEVAGQNRPFVGFNVEPPVQAIDTWTGAQLTIGGVWTNASDVALKQGFENVDARIILATVSELPISSWSYKSEDSSIKHIGPTAQDFHAAFGLGASSKNIGTVDADGIALLSIQALHDLVKSLEAANASLREDQAKMDERNRLLEAKVSEMERSNAKLAGLQISASEIMRRLESLEALSSE